MPEHPYDLAGLLSSVRAARWMDAPGRQAARLDVVDHADLTTGGVPLRLLVLGPADQVDVRYSVPVTWDATGRVREAHPSEPFDRAVTAALRAGRRVRTARGGVVEFDGTAPPLHRRVPFDPGWSSNTLSLVDLGGELHVHKAYRRLVAGLTEPAALRRMAGTGYTAAHRGDYRYVGPGDRRRWPLGVLYGYVPGDPLDVPLRDSLRALWTLPPADDRPSALREHLRPLEPALRHLGRFLRGFHDTLARTVDGGAPFPVPDCAGEVTDRLATLRPRIEADQRLPAAVRAATLDGLTTALHRAVAEADALPAPPAGPCHGDLHLGHVLVRARPDRSWDLRLVDLSPPALDPAHPAFATSSPWQDLVSLRRALEYFTADEAYLETARQVGGTEEEVCRAALWLAADVSPERPQWTDDRLARLRQLGRAADRWRERVLELVLHGYHGSPAPVAAHPVSRLLHLRRLLHELGYNYDHDRPYFTAMDLRYAVRLRDGLAVTAGRRAVRP